MRLSRRSLFIGSLYYQLFYYQEIVEQLGIYYNRLKFNRINEYLSKYDLHQYRRLHPGHQVDSAALKKYHIKTPFYVYFFRCFYLYYILRTFAIVAIKPTTSTRDRRIWIGSEHWQSSAPVTECQLMLWSIIDWLFFQFTLTNSAFDYKFLALFRMSDKCSRFLHPLSVGLSKICYEKFKRFRSYTALYYHSLFVSLVPVSMLAMVAIHLRAKMFTTHPFWATVSLVQINFWIYVCIAILYTLLLCFINVAFYIYLKQHSISTTLLQKYHNLVVYCTAKRNFKNRQHIELLTSKLLGTSRHYLDLYAELAEYTASFWSGYLFYVFIFYCFIVAFALYVFLYVQMVWYMNVAYFLIFVNHAINMSAIIIIAGSVVRQNEVLASKCCTLTGQLAYSSRWFYAKTFIKLHTLNESISQLSKSGFRLSNGYLITHNTAQLIIGNILVYFILTLSNVLY